MSGTGESGLERIARVFAGLRESRRGGLMPFICGQHPRPGATAETLLRLDGAGADIVEIGFPFSDPIADGPVIAGAMHDALQAGASIAGLLDEVAGVRERIRCGLIAMVTVSIVSRMGGPGEFAKRIARSGFDGMIVPDVPIEEAGDLASAADAAGLALGLLVAPSTTAERAQRIMASCRGFVYVLARSGITGERSDSPQVASRIRELRGLSDLPLAVGFGISTADHVAAACEHADAAIVGSALVRRMGQSGDPAGEAAAFVAELARGTSRGAARGADQQSTAQ